MDSSRKLLDTAYKELDFEGVLSRASKTPDAAHPEDWVERGDWLSLAKEVGAETVFFLDRHPAILFAELKQSDDASLREFFNQVWCMARPQLLFLARPGELSVFDLTKPPIKPNESPGTHQRLLDTAKSVAEVQAWRNRFHRQLIQSGAFFGDEHFGKGLDRADHALIRDLKEVRRALDALKLAEGARPTRERKAEILHSLIGRAIFIRYLEDREIITGDYFKKVVDLHAKGAEQKKAWLKLLHQPLTRPDLNPAMERLYFPRVLPNKAFAYALFDQLAHDFNGDTFPVCSDERRFLLQTHLNTLRDFLLGIPSGQQELFFYAYSFKIIPIELISSIYEEFYNERVGDRQNQGSHYTPPTLVEFVLANTLTPDVLARTPRVLDPACGSGIFLVESFRRIVRYYCAQRNKSRPSREELRTLLRTQIAGIDINEEAVRVAAFSLYLAFLHYQTPREILPDPGKNLDSSPETLRLIRLPYLKYFSGIEKQQCQRAKPAAEFFDALLAASAFDPITGKCDLEANQKFGEACADVIVGNPPWGSWSDSKPTVPRAKEAIAGLKAWCDPALGRPVGDNERSQAFIHLALSMLKEGGRAGLLVSSGVFFKHHQNSKAFRKVWLNAVRLQQVVNFAHVRDVFFSGPNRKAKAIAPFASVVFEKVPLSAEPHYRFSYWSAKRTSMVEKTKVVLMSRGDMHYLKQADCLRNETLWKIYWWGGHQDEVFLKSLERFPELSKLPTKLPETVIIPGQGFKEANKAERAGWLSKYQELPIKHFRSYGPLPNNKLIRVPKKVERRGVEEVYSGRRLLVRRGIPEGGTLTVRLETTPFCFRHSIIGFRFEGFEPWQEKVILGIYWSSLARYVLYLTAGSWGMWHDELQVDTAASLPICLPQSLKDAQPIVKIVDKLQTVDVSSEGLDLFDISAEHKISVLETQLDRAVFDLYEMTPAERDLVQDMCKTGLELFYKGSESHAVKAVARLRKKFGTIADLDEGDSGLDAYLYVFLECLNKELRDVGEFAWQILAPSSKAPLLAVVFEPRFHEDASEPFKTVDEEAWDEVLKRLAKEAHMPTASSRVFIDTFFRIVTEHEILIVKRDEQRFWTKSAAREDAEAVMLKLILAQEQHRKTK